MQNQENKAKVTYWLNGEIVSKEEFGSLVGEYFKWFDGSDVKAVDYSSVEPIFNGEHKSQRQINDHLKGVLGETVKGNSTRHKYSGEGDFHKDSFDIKNIVTIDVSQIVDCASSANNIKCLKNNCLNCNEELYNFLLENPQYAPTHSSNKQQEQELPNHRRYDLVDTLERWVGNLEGINRPPQEPFSIQVPKPTAFNQSDFFDKKQQEQEILDTFKRNMDKIEGVKETEGVKLNKNKPQMSLLFRQFPKALEAIVKCSEYGNEKYKETDKDFLNFKRVEGGSKTYADAGLRHRMQQGIDLESMLPHAYHVAWNALAELELILENK